jgi:hypothetical protein
MKEINKPTSIDWNTQERFYLIAELARELQLEASLQGDQRYNDFAKRIEHIAVMPKSFLEQNEDFVMGTEYNHIGIATNEDSDT